MVSTNKLENYLALLTIRQAARRRDTFLAGGVFLSSFTGMIVLGMLDNLTGRTLFLAATMVVGFGITYLMAWMKCEIIKGSIELIDNLLLMNEGGDIGQ